MKILIQGSTILAAGNFSETDDAFVSSDAVFPKTVITGWQIVEATLPDDYAHGKYTFSAGVFTLRVIPVTAEEKAAFIAQVKSEAGALTQQVLSGLGSEYELAEAEATAYKTAGYTGTVPGSVADEVASKAAKGMTITATVACDSILAAATGWRQAQAALRRNRLTVSSAASVAVDAAGLNSIKAQWAALLVALKTQLGV
jgi:hypothetical protein